MRELTWVEKARRLAGMTQADAGKVAGMCGVTFGKKEKDPAQFTLREFFAVRKAMPLNSRQLMDHELDDLKAGARRADY